MTDGVADYEPPGNYMPPAGRYPEDQMLKLEPRERAERTPHGLTWWVALLVYGKSTPVPDDFVAHAKWKWYRKYDDTSRDSLSKAAKEELDGLRSSTSDIISRIAVVAVVAAIGIQPVQSLLTGATAPGTVSAWPSAW